MKKGNRRIFNDKEALQEMLTLRDKGWSLIALATRFDCDHTSIIFQCRKHGVKPISEKIITIKQTRHLKPRLSNGRIDSLLRGRLREVWDNPVDEKGEKVNKGKLTMKEYYEADKTK